MKQSSVKFVILTPKTSEAQKERKIGKFKMNKEEFLYLDLTDKIIKSALEVHKTIGPGFHEKIYERALAKQFQQDKLDFENQKRIDIQYLGEKVGYHFLDFLVSNKVIVELKTLSELSNIYLSQMITYLKATSLNVGLVLNFAMPTLEIRRVSI